jgi:hypothetical protein
MDVKCPMCKTSFTLDWLGIERKVGTVATVVCVCAHQLDVTIHNEPRRILGVKVGKKSVRVAVSGQG